ncbi:aminotransferase class V-fold PLP-dependent enzyme [Janthinobacterium agaricidamnosum]|uniref:Aminotransferase class-V family protein n=1 Tax=Janthinobacterium agaricidamnosum NBRC 102515 = DSM 9628 TaxID=1349767 RepID=W0V533_9BURK|nr:aminotransferase class V-fold PLP-dependent enzyme [Janthinobacterium agaricidamnosum]CDG82730.1 aminotransferase class-V family protein [Janthinobacterium agaricidamnosum NBRC 102515 = DSM 9628]
MTVNQAVNRRRRAWLRTGMLLPLVPGCALAAGQAPLAALPAAPSGVAADALALDRQYWSGVAAQYDMSDQAVLLDNGYWGSMARPVLAAYQENLARVNRGNSFYARQDFPHDYQAARRRTATALGVAPDEIVFTRGATEALLALIGGYRGLRSGDTVLYADIDYDGMICAMQWLKQRRGVDVVSISLPEPATHQSVIDCYAQALERHPKLKLMLLTHVNHRNGMVLPVAEISRMARRRGVDVIVDTAHGFGQLDMRIPDLEADFAGINLHKWIGAPVGVGAVYIKRSRIEDIEPCMGQPDDANVYNRVHTGTANFAAFMTLPLAFDLHDQIGVANKQARLRLLRNRWVEAARDIKGIDVLASPDPRLASAISSFRLRGKTSLADNVALAKRLLDEHGIFTVHRDGLASGACIRVTPAVFTPEEDMDRLLLALRKIAGSA